MLIGCLMRCSVAVSRASLFRHVSQRLTWGELQAKQRELLGMVEALQVHMTHK